MAKYSFIFLITFCFFVLSNNNVLKIQNKAVLLQNYCYNTSNMELFDMHCHLLPHVDDGFVEWNELGNYLDLYKSCGFSGIIFTPHLYDPYVTTDVKALRDSWIRANRLCEEKGLFSSLASEIYVLNEETVKGVPIMARYALVEFPTEFAPPALFEKLESLSPLIPIIAHIERYKWLSPESEALKEMKARGYLIQVNGRPRERMMMPVNAVPAEMEKLALGNANVQKQLEGKNVVKVICVPKRVVNIVAK